MRWSVVLCALMLWACNVASSADGGPYLADSGTPAADGGRLVDGSGGGIDCEAGRTKIISDIESAASGLRDCENHSDCEVYYWTTGCLNACGSAIAGVGKTRMEKAVQRISAERCTAEFVEICGIVAADCPASQAYCAAGQCERAPEGWTADAGTPDATGRDAGPCDPDLYCAQVDENGCCGDSFGKVSDCMTPATVCPPGMRVVRLSDCKCSGRDVG